jgi:hypothetical protein
MSTIYEFVKEQRKDARVRNSEWTRQRQASDVMARGAVYAGLKGVFGW